MVTRKNSFLLKNIVLASQRRPYLKKLILAVLFTVIVIMAMPAAASAQTALTLNDFDDATLDVKFKALITAGRLDLYSASQGSIVDGDLDWSSGSTATSFTRIRDISTSSLRLNNTDAVFMGTFFASTGAGTGYRLWIQVASDQATTAVASFVISGAYTSAGGNFLNLATPTAFDDVLNTIGEGERFIFVMDDPANQETIPDVPVAPIVAAASATSATITWVEPDDNGPAISSYDLRYRVVGAPSWTDAADITGLTYTAASLSAGTQYEAQVRATNNLGDSAYSLSGTGSTLSSAPSTPSRPTVTAASTTSVTIVWVAPGNNGAAISSYDLRYRVVSVFDWTNVTDITGLTYTATSLSAGMQYEAQVRATNSEGDSSYSFSGRGYTSVTAPSTPVAPTVTAASTTSVTIVWVAPDNNGAAIDSYDLRYGVVGVSSWTNVSDLTGLTYTATSLSVGTQYEAQVRATNSQGDSSYSSSGTGSTTAIAPSTPSTPSAPTVTAASTTSVTIVWVAPGNNGAAISSYDLRYQATGTNSWTNVSDLTSLTYTAASLSVGTQYEAQVRATNSQGDSSYSLSGTGSTTAAAPSTPVAPFVWTTSTTTITIGWVAPDDNGAAINSYDVRYRVLHTSNWTTASDITGLRYYPTGLNKGSWYQAQVRATNSQGDSAYSATGQGYTRIDAPETPTAPTVTTASTTSVTIAWTAPAANGAGISSYDLRYRVADTSLWTDVSDIRGRTYTATSLSIGTRYEVQVRATNNAGDSSYSLSGTGSTTAAAPSTPSAPTVTAASTTSVTIVWVAPDNNGAAIDSYDLRYRATDTSTWTNVSDLTGLTYTTTSLNVGARYEAQVRATNSQGDSAYSASGTGGTTAAVPFTPSAPTVAAASTTSVTIVWVAPGNNGAAISSYDLRYKATGTSLWTNVSDVTGLTYTAASLSAGTRYEAQVRATNSRGDSSYSVSGTGSTTAAAPSTPSAPTVTAASTTSVTIVWVAPGNNGAAISSYDLRYRVVGAPSWTDVADITGLTHTATSLSIGARYEAQVRATNSQGDSSYSVSGTGSTTATTPSTPSAPTVTAASTTSVTIVWVAPGNNGAAISSYDLRYRVVGAPSWTDAADISGLTYTATSLSVGTRYEAQVRATNSQGNSAYSTSGTGSTTAAVPFAPSAPTVTAASTTSVTIVWVAPGNNGAAISSYDLRYRATGAPSWTNVSDLTGLTYTATRLADGKRYEAQVRATNSKGDSSYSSLGTGRTTVIPGALILDDFDDSGLDVKLKVLIASGSGELYSSIVGSTHGSIVDGDLNWSSSSTATSFTRIRNLGPSSLRLHNATGVTLSDFFGGSGAGSDYRLWIQVASDQANPVVASFVISDVYVGAGGNYLNLAPSSAFNDVISTIGNGERFIFVMDDPTNQTVPSTPSTPTVTAASTTSVTIAWVAPDNNGAAISSYDLLYRATGTPSWTNVSDLTGLTYTATNLSVGTQYEAQVRAANSNGNSSYSLLGTGSTTAIVPSIPSTPTVTAASTTSVTIVWVEPADNGAAISSYDLRYRATGTPSWTNVSDLTGLTYTASSLSVGTRYEAQVRATNSQGDSAYSLSGTGGTTATVPSKPSTPTVTGASTTSVTIVWVEPADNGAAISSYDLRYRATGTPSWTNVSDLTGLTYTATSLSAGTRYEAQVRAANSKGNSSYSSSGTGSTTATAPSTPSTPTVTAASTTSVTIAWVEPADNGTAISSYDLRYRATGTPSWTNVSDLTGLTYTATSLSVGTLYEAQVRATNSKGDSSYSSSGTGSTTATAPSTPSAPTVTAASATSVTIVWVAPGNNGAAISSYDLRYRVTNAPSWTDVSDITGLTYTATSLSAGVQYEAQVRATNSQGDSSYSVSGIDRTTATAPSTPSAPIVTAASTTSVTIVWVAPAANGAAISSYDLRYRVTNAPSWTDVSDITGLTYTATSLSAGSQYEAQVRATNSQGDSSYSSSGIDRITATAPSTPSAPTVTAASTTSVTIVWVAPAANGAAISSYDLRYKATGTSLWTNVSDLTSLTYTAASLSVGTRYEAQVRATNSQGDSSYSVSRTGSTTATAPSTPSTPTVTAASTTSVAIVWVAPGNNGAAISSYDLRYKATGTSLWTNISDIRGLTYTVTNLSTGTRYEAQVRATNSKGDSAYSSLGTGGTTAAAPSTPNTPTVTTTSATSVTVAWIAPSNNGDSITGYDLRYRVQGTNLWTDVSSLSGLSYIVTGLTSTATYEAQVRATNSEGDSSYSSSGTGNTTSFVIMVTADQDIVQLGTLVNLTAAITGTTDEGTYKWVSDIGGFFSQPTSVTTTWTAPMAVAGLDKATITFEAFWTDKVYTQSLTFTVDSWLVRMPVRVTNTSDAAYDNFVYLFEAPTARLVTGGFLTQDTSLKFKTETGTTLDALTGLNSDTSTGFTPWLTRASIQGHGTTNLLVQLLRGDAQTFPLWPNRSNHSLIIPASSLATSGYSTLRVEVEARIDNPNANMTIIRQGSAWKLEYIHTTQTLRASGTTGVYLEAPWTGELTRWRFEVISPSEATLSKHDRVWNQVDSLSSGEAIGLTPSSDEVTIAPLYNGIIDDIRIGRPNDAPQAILDFETHDIRITKTADTFSGTIRNRGTTGGTVVWAFTLPTNSYTPEGVASAINNLHFSAAFQDTASSLTGEVPDIAGNLDLGQLTDVPDAPVETEDTFGVFRILREAGVDSGNPEAWWLVLTTVLAIILAAGVSRLWSNLWVTFAIGLAAYIGVTTVTESIGWWIPAWYTIWSLSVIIIYERGKST